MDKNMQGIVHLGIFIPPLLLAGVYMHQTIKDLRETNRETGRTIAHATDGIYYKKKT